MYKYAYRSKLHTRYKLLQSSGSVIPLCSIPFSEISLEIPHTVPNLTQTPLNENADIATSINLTCSAEGYPPPTYQWYKDGLALPGETRPFLYIPELLPSERGSYLCEASNIEGQMSSDSTRVDISGISHVIVLLFF